MPYPVHRLRLASDATLAACAALALARGLFRLLPFTAGGAPSGLLPQLARRHLGEAFLLALLLVAAVLLSVIAYRATCHKSALRRYWWVLAIQFWVVVAIKALPIYSRLLGFLTRLDGGIRHRVSAPVVAVLASAVALATALYFLPFLTSLLPRLRWSFVAGGAIFLLGAIGIELISKRYCGLYGSDSAPHILASFFENLFEMAGLLVFIDGLLLALTGQSPPAHPSDPLQNPSNSPADDPGSLASPC